MNVFITKYALSVGIVEAELLKKHGDGFNTVRWRGGFNDEAYFTDKECYETLDVAIGRAEDMRIAKIASLEKQIRKLRNLTFGGQKGKRKC